eukprot:TRINITY_DN4861_c0_g1_i2.p1 TRINITY_DN4861_c0_g1~~TRINITY_DN4861_c0_g1_i2.p1  ORF type:complete len:1991 (-),score=180.32 TRINITY_DN4861_c0_g1_i2:5457-11258(-)
MQKVPASTCAVSQTCMLLQTLEVDTCALDRHANMSCPAVMFGPPSSPAVASPRLAQGLAWHDRLLMRCAAGIRWHVLLCCLCLRLAYGCRTRLEVPHSPADAPPSRSNAIRRPRRIRGRRAHDPRFGWKWRFHWRIGLVQASPCHPHGRPPEAPELCWFSAHHDVFVWEPFLHVSRVSRWAWALLPLVATCRLLFTTFVSPWWPVLSTVSYCCRWLRSFAHDSDHCPASLDVSDGFVHEDDLEQCHYSDAEPLAPRIATLLSGASVRGIRGGAGGAAATCRKRDEMLLGGLQELIKAAMEQDAARTAPAPAPDDGFVKSKRQLKRERQAARRLDQSTADAPAQDKSQDLLAALQGLVNKCRKDESIDLLAQLKKLVDDAVAQRAKPATAPSLPAKATAVQAKAQPKAQPRAQPKAQPTPKAKANAKPKGALPKTSASEARRPPPSPRWTLDTLRWKRGQVISLKTLNWLVDSDSSFSPTLSDSDKKKPVEQQPQPAIAACMTLAQYRDIKELVADSSNNTRFGCIITDDLCDDAQAPSGAEQRWILTSKHGSKKVWVAPLFAALPDFPSVTVCATKGKPTDINDWKSLRITVHQAFVANDWWTTLRTDPSKAVAALLPEGVEGKTSIGNLTPSDGNGSDMLTLTLYVKVRQQHVDTIYARSGTRGVFVDFLSADRAQRDHEPATWIQRKDNEAWRAYFERALTFAAGRPLGWRRGGSSCLGVRGLVDKEQAHRWSLCGVPRSWSPYTLQRWLEEQGWDASKVTAPRARGGRWSFSAKPPSNYDGKDTFAITYDLGLLGAITLTRWKRPPPEKPDATPVSARPGWCVGAVSSQPASNADKAMDTDSALPPKSDKGADDDCLSARSRSRSPPPKPAKQEQAQDPAPTASAAKSKEPASTAASAPAAKRLRAHALPFDLSEWDLGGTGDCGFRVLAALGALANGKTEDEVQDKCETLAKSLRKRVHKALKSSIDGWSPGWAVDPDATELTDGGPVAHTADEWLEAVARPNYWICGRTLAAVAEVLKVKVMIWELRADKWALVAVFGSSSTLFPIFLKHQHYVLGRKPRGGWPAELKNATPLANAKVSRAAGKSVASSSASSWLRPVASHASSASSSSRRASSAGAAPRAAAHASSAEKAADQLKQDSSCSWSSTVKRASPCSRSRCSVACDAPKVRCSKAEGVFRQKSGGSASHATAAVGKSGASVASAPRAATSDGSHARPASADKDSRGSSCSRSRTFSRLSCCSSTCCNAGSCRLRVSEASGNDGSQNGRVKPSFKARPMSTASVPTASAASASSRCASSSGAAPRAASRDSPADKAADQQEQVSPCSCTSSVKRASSCSRSRCFVACDAPKVCGFESPVCRLKSSGSASHATAAVGASGASVASASCAATSNGSHARPVPADKDSRGSSCSRSRTFSRLSCCSSSCCDAGSCRLRVSEASGNDGSQYGRVKPCSKTRPMSTASVSSCDSWLRPPESQGSAARGKARSTCSATSSFMRACSCSSSRCVGLKQKISVASYGHARSVPTATGSACSSWLRPPPAAKSSLPASRPAFASSRGPAPQDDDIANLDDLNGFEDVQVSVSKRASAATQWTCPECHWTTTSKFWPQLKHKHLAKWHPNLARSLGARKPAPVALIDVSSIENVQWKCPCCNLGIVGGAFTEAGRELRRKHGREAHPRRKPSLFLVSQGAQGKLSIRRAQAACRNAAIARRALSDAGDHQVEQFIWPKGCKRAGRSDVCCSSCRRIAKSVSQLKAQPCKAIDQCKHGGGRRRMLAKAVAAMSPVDDLDRERLDRLKQLLGEVDAPLERVSFDKPVRREPFADGHALRRMTWPLGTQKGRFAIICVACGSIDSDKKKYLKRKCQPLSKDVLPYRRSSINRLDAALKKSRDAVARRQAGHLLSFLQKTCQEPPAKAARRLGGHRGVPPNPASRF